VRRHPSRRVGDPSPPRGHRRGGGRLLPVGTGR
jgi:hypothetical protein